LLERAATKEERFQTSLYEGNERNVREETLRSERNNYSRLNKRKALYR